jgi:hypothetical protein
MKSSAIIVLMLVLLQILMTQTTTHAQSCPEPTSCGVEVALSSTPVEAHVINAYGPPPVTRIPPNEELLYDRLYQRVLQPVEIYDAPHGAVIGGLDAGFNFVTALDNTPDGWTMINQGQWVRSEHLRTVYPSRFAGILLPESRPQYPIAWILVNAIPSQTPGTDPAPGTLAILRYTLVNLFAEVEIDGWSWYQIGSDQWVHQTQVARVIPVERPAEVDTERWISVDLYEQVAIAYEGARPVWATLVSSGLAQWPTNEGLFHVYVRFPRTIMSGSEGQSDFYYLEEVPWTMYFDNDIGLHGTYWHDGFGYRHSHGCVNLSITDAAWLYHWASTEIDLTVPGDLGAAVYVYSSGQYR